MPGKVLSPPPTLVMMSRSGAFEARRIVAVVLVRPVEHGALERRAEQRVREIVQRLNIPICGNGLLPARSWVSHLCIACRGVGSGHQLIMRRAIDLLRPRSPLFERHREEVVPASSILTSGARLAGPRTQTTSWILA
jgi:hypothetical protein